jgi:hypothetical protein
MVRGSIFFLITASTFVLVVGCRYSVPALDFETGTAKKSVPAVSSRIDGAGGAGGASASEARNEVFRAEEASRLWALYRMSKAGSGKPGAELLGAIAAMGFAPGTRSVVTDTIQLLRANVSAEEKIGLLRLLSVNFYWDTHDKTVRSEIARAISETALASTDKEVVKAATIAYTRLEYFPDTLKVLNRAYELDAIARDSYYGEMAHMIVGSPPAEQLTLLRNIDAGKSDYSRDVLVSTLANKDYALSLSPEVQAAAVSLLAKWEPDLGVGFGGVSAIVWEHWLDASVTLNAKLSARSEKEVMAKLLKVDGSADPRKLMIALWNESTAEIVKEAFDRGTLASIDAKLSAYGANNPDRGDIREEVELARRNLASIKRK